MASLTRRRALLSASAIIPVALLAACSGVTLTPAQIITQASAVASGLSGMVMAVSDAYPALIPPATLKMIEADIVLAQQAASHLVPNMPAATGAVTVQTIEGYINAVLNALAAPPVNGLIPAPFNMAVAAAAIVVPQLETFVALYIPTAAAASPAMASARMAMRAAAPMVNDVNAVAVLQSFAK